MRDPDLHILPEEQAVWPMDTPQPEDKFKACCRLRLNAFRISGLLKMTQRHLISCATASVSDLQHVSGGVLVFNEFKHGNSFVAHNGGAACCCALHAVDRTIKNRACIVIVSLSIYLCLNSVFSFVLDVEHIEYVIIYIVLFLQCSWNLEETCELRSLFLRTLEIWKSD